jgi:putative phosphonate metabolism protein
MPFTRYAVYFTPPPGPLSDFGAAWLGWDPARGIAVPHPDIPGLPAPVGTLTEAPRKYGLHATMKPPFALAPGATGAALRDAFAAFCATTAPVTLDGLAVATLGRFLALRPEGDETGIGTLAAACVRSFEPFRAPLTGAQLARRRAGGLSVEQEARLERWGYPHVMEGFRFHITLTGPRPKSELPVLRAVLEQRLAPLLARPFPVDALSLMGEDDAGRFHLVHRHALAG